MGGLVGNLPSSILVARVLVALTNGTAFASRAALAVPAGMTVDAVLLLVFVLSLSRGLLLATAASLPRGSSSPSSPRDAGIEEISSARWSSSPSPRARSWRPRWARKVRSVPGARRRYGPAEMAARAAFAGAVVGGTVLVSASVGTYWTGLLATFPAVVLSTMVIPARCLGMPSPARRGRR